MNSTDSFYKRSSGFKTNGNIIRFLCALAVIFSHSYNLSQNISDPISTWTNEMISIGGIAVIIFFFYSGFYVTKSIVHSKNLMTFFKKRCLRLFPPLIIVVLICAFILGPLITSNNLYDYFTNTETYLYLLNGLLIPIHNLPGVFETNIYGPTVNGALWTMPIEFACYLSLIFITAFSIKVFNKRRSFKKLIIVITCICLILQIILELLKLNYYAALTRPVMLFLIGSSTYLWAKKIKYNNVFCIISVAIIAIAWFTPIFSILISIFLPYPIMYLTLAKKQISKSITIINYSYEMYLIAFPIQQLLVFLWGGGQMPIIINIVFAIIIEILIMLVYDWTRRVLNNVKNNKK